MKFVVGDELPDCDARRSAKARPLRLRVCRIHLASQSILVVMLEPDF
jgi:hypothetical protein